MFVESIVRKAREAQARLDYQRAYNYRLRQLTGQGSLGDIIDASFDDASRGELSRTIETRRDEWQSQSE